MRQRQIDALLILCSKVLGLLQSCLAELPKLNKEWPITNNTPPTICRRSKSVVKRWQMSVVVAIIRTVVAAKQLVKCQHFPLMWQESYRAGLELPGKVYYSGLHAGAQFIKPYSHSRQCISHSSLQNSFWREAAAVPSHRPWTLMLLFVG